MKIVKGNAVYPLNFNAGENFRSSIHDSFQVSFLKREPRFRGSHGAAARPREERRMTEKSENLFL